MWVEAGVGVAVGVPAGLCKVVGVAAVDGGADVGLEGED